MAASTSTSASNTNTGEQQEEEEPFAVTRDQGFLPVRYAKKARIAVPHPSPDPPTRIHSLIHPHHRPQSQRPPPPPAPDQRALHGPRITGGRAPQAPRLRERHAPLADHAAPARLACGSLAGGGHAGGKGAGPPPPVLHRARLRLVRPFFLFVLPRGAYLPSTNFHFHPPVVPPPHPHIQGPPRLAAGRGAARPARNTVDPGGRGAGRAPAHPDVRVV